MCETYLLMHFFQYVHVREEYLLYIVAIMYLTSDFRVHVIKEGRSVLKVEGVTCTL